jgi:hypothetical protein
LIVASDKTQLTLQSWDLAVHAVYLPVGNLRAKARHFNERPGPILLALLPSVKEGDATERAKLFHLSLSTIFDSVRKAVSKEQNGVEIACVDGWVSSYHNRLRRTSKAYRNGKRTTVYDVYNPL